MTTGIVSGGAPIASQLGITLRLCRGENLQGRQMVLEMRSAQSRLRIADLFHQGREARRRDRFVSKPVVESGLLGDQLFANCNGLGCHGREQCLYPVSLVSIQIQLLGKPDGMTRPWIAIELGGQSQAQCQALNASQRFAGPRAP